MYAFDRGLEDEPFTWKGDQLNFNDRNDVMAPASDIIASELLKCAGLVKDSQRLINLGMNYRGGLLHYRKKLKTVLKYRDIYDKKIFSIKYDPETNEPIITDKPITTDKYIITDKPMQLLTRAEALGWEEKEKVEDV
jgi:hypothetical protein